MMTRQEVIDSLARTRGAQVEPPLVIEPTAEQMKGLSAIDRLTFARAKRQEMDNANIVR